MIEIIIKGEAKEIAALVLAVQERLSNSMSKFCCDDMGKTLQETNGMLKHIASTLEHVSEDIALWMRGATGKSITNGEFFKRKNGDED